jgi:plastocyanin
MLARTLAILLLAVALAPATAGAATLAVSVKDDFFVAKSVTIARGDSVRWVWRGRHKHNVVSPAFGNSRTQRHGSFVVHFTHPGRYQYFCGLHDGMSGTVVVRR